MAAERFQKTCRIPSYTLFSDELSTMENSIHIALRDRWKSGKHIAALKYLKQEAGKKNCDGEEWHVLWLAGKPISIPA